MVWVSGEGPLRLARYAKLDSEMEQCLPLLSVSSVQYSSAVRKQKTGRISASGDFNPNGRSLPSLPPSPPNGNGDFMIWMPDT